MKRIKLKPKYLPWTARVFLSVFLLVMFIGAVAILAMSNLLKGEIMAMETDTLQRQVQQQSDMMDQICLMQIQKADHLLADDTFLLLLASEEEDVGERYQLRNEVGQRLSKAEAQMSLAYQGYTADSTYRVNTYLSVLTDNPSLLPSYDSSTSLVRVQSLERERYSGWYQELMEGGQTFTWGKIQTLYGSKYLTGYRKIRDISNFNVLGVLKISIPLSDLRSALRESKDDLCQVLYQDSEGKEIFSIEATQSSNSDGERQIQCQATSQLTGNTLVFLFPEDAILQSFNNFYKLLVLVMVLIFLGGVPVIFLLSSRLSRRIRRLAHKTKVLAEGDFSVLSQPVQGNDEIAGLERRFNSMVVRLKGMLENEVRFKGQIEEMKVELLQEQINPHLLYNTLAMIRYQARNAGLTDLAELSDSLIVFYRRFLNEGNFISTIGSELTMIGQYIQVVQKVYAINLTVEYDLPPGIEEYYAVKLFFQPVVENAIVHGIRPIGEGELKISASLHEGKVIFEIYDNGCGIEGEELETLRKCLKGESPREQMRSVGLYNVNQRIRLIYGPQYGLEIDSVPGEGTLVKVTIPLMGEREKQAFMEEHGLNL